jgi:hypothetical protein
MNWKEVKLLLELLVLPRVCPQFYFLPTYLDSVCSNHEGYCWVNPPRFMSDFTILSVSVSL